MNTFATINYSTENKTQEHKFETLSCGYEEVHSPSTDYTDAEYCEVARKEEFSSDYFLYSSKFLSEVAALEPLVEAMPQFLLDSNCESDYKMFNTELKIDWESKPIAKIPRKISKETAVEEEEEQEEESELQGWTEKKDKTLKNLASKCKYDWKKIAKKFNATEETNYSPVDLKQKYKDLNKVAIPLRVKFTHEEDLMIAKYYDIYGCDWVQIATFFSDRTAIMLKNRYYSHIRKRNLLSSMLEEVKCSGEEEVVESPMEEANEEVQAETENYERSLEMTQFNSLFFEVENALASQLYDRITVSYI